MARGDRLGEGTFCVTYADGVADVDLEALLRFHYEAEALATVTVVRPNLQWGVAELEDDRVCGFVEKPRSEHWVNGGFFCFEPAAVEVFEPDSVLEHEPLQRLAGAGELRAFRHEGFWDCMDTYKDAIELGDLWSQGRAPWKPRSAAAISRVPGPRSIASRTSATTGTRSSSRRRTEPQTRRYRTVRSPS